jgi:hypothetical protein
MTNSAITQILCGPEFLVAFPFDSIGLSIGCCCADCIFKKIILTMPNHDTLYAASA